MEFHEIMDPKDSPDFENRNLICQTSTVTIIYMTGYPNLAIKLNIKVKYVKHHLFIYLFIWVILLTMDRNWAKIWIKIWTKNLSIENLKTHLILALSGYIYIYRV
jgi:cell division protein FtsW (lipid II flippase)